ncbi:C-type lectin 37Db-like [Scaptodrosophila lebanonensis]|uniref:C-type lectin 37Db-like n=1 Tax=Drosophila lebanonensis TaxID=7225 RepID=A0A6J2TQ54_DROLE|nr:C-type lectin 37Db-like [Scaptodrosophila lebanonensis]
MYLYYYSITILVLCSTLSHLSAANVIPKTQVHVRDGIPNGIPVDIAPFKKIGDKYYFIEEGVALNWFEADHKCHQLGGHLLHLESEAELKAIEQHMTGRHYYWTDITDLGQSGNYVSTTTGLKATFLKWLPNEPNNYGGNEHCIHLWDTNHSMNDYNCKQPLHFICEKNSPRTVSVVVW